VRAHEIVAVIGKTEGNGGVNDFTRGYFTQTLMALLGQHFGEPAEALMQPHSKPLRANGRTPSTSAPTRSSTVTATRSPRLLLAMGCRRYPAIGILS
jgi:hypothetical protein